MPKMLLNELCLENGDKMEEITEQTKDSSR
jgi:hypothetical protein